MSTQAENLTRSTRLVPHVVWTLLTLVAMACAIVLSRWAWWVPVAVAVVGAGLAGLLFLIGRVRKRTERRPTALLSALRGAAVALALVGTPLLFLLYRAAFVPLLAPNVVLVRGDRTLVLQGMSHIASESFFKSVVFDLQQALADGYVLFYEGVRPSPGEGDEWFTPKSGGSKGNANINDAFTTLAQGCGLNFQLDYFKQLEAHRLAHPEQHVDADVTTLDIKHEAERLAQTDPDVKAWIAQRLAPRPAEKPDSTVVAVMFGVVDAISRADAGKKGLFGQVCRGLYSLTQELPETETPSANGKVLLYFRNRALLSRIESAPQRKIYVTYGEDHIPDLVRSLQASSMPWTVTSVHWASATTGLESAGTAANPLARPK